jgi:hypothetical protein
MMHIQSLPQLTHTYGGWLTGLAESGYQPQESLLMCARSHYHHGL